MDPNAQAGVKDQISKLQREIKMLRHQLRQPGPEQPPNIPQKSGVNTRAKKVGPRQTQRVILHKPPVHNSTVTPEANVPAKYNDWPLGVDPSLFCYRYLVGFKIFAPNMPNTPVASIEDLQRYPVVLNPLVLTGVLITPELYDIVEPLNTPEARMAAIRQHPDSHLSLRSGDLVLWSVEFGAAEDGTVPKIYVRTDAAWYLLIDPVPEYQPLFRVLFDKCMLVQNMLDALVVEPRLSLTGPLNKFGIDFNQVKQHSTFLLHHIKSLNDDKINSSILVQELTRMAPPEQTLPPILPPGVFLLPQPNAQLPPGTTPVVTPATPAVSESKFNLVSLPKPVYDNNNYSVPADPMPAAAPRAYPSIKLKTNTSYTPPTNGHSHSQPLNVTPVLPQSVVPQHVMPQHVPQHVPQPVMPQNIPQPVLSQPEPVAEAEQQTEHDTTHDELDFETGFDLEGVFVNDSQDDHHIEGLNASSYFSLS